ncbi:hypothetical protein BV898_16744 [Hypsibius exemplaris]|uniref:Uncharacterized protein n=1 Tax=Hypsibius exemplaris TaxID=2072580 RepID=A0A9X6NKT2_HYPEX|nr:hypothetical protein BV898_16744 [Hypsibius exemplaris]
MSDENFLDNPFYIALSRQFSDLYAKACARKCIICIPIKSSLHMLSRGNSLMKHRALIPKAELGLHILQPSPLQSLEEGLYDCVQNGYSVKIERPTGGKNGIIRGYSGFARSFSAEILSEEKCYDEKSGGSFTMLIIDHPLGEGMDVYTKPPPTLEYTFDKLSSASCEDYLRESLGSLDSACIIGTFKKSIEQLYRTYVLLEGYLDDLASKIRSLVTKTVDESVRAVPSINRRDTAAAFEVFGHNILYPKLFPFLHEKEYAAREKVISVNMESVRKPTTIDGLNIESATFPLAAATLLKLPAQTSPLQQLVCVASALQALQTDRNIIPKESSPFHRVQSTSSITARAGRHTTS